MMQRQKNTLISLIWSPGSSIILDDLCHLLVWTSRISNDLKHWWCFINSPISLRTIVTTKNNNAVILSQSWANKANLSSLITLRLLPFWKESKSYNFLQQINTKKFRIISKGSPACLRKVYCATTTASYF